MIDGPLCLGFVARQYIMAEQKPHIPGAKGKKEPESHNPPEGMPPMT
jgi:hypothetical protein